MTEESDELGPKVSEIRGKPCRINPGCCVAHPGYKMLVCTLSGVIRDFTRRLKVRCGWPGASSGHDEETAVMTAES